MSFGGRAAGALALALSISACAPRVTVQRAVDGRVVQGDFVPGEAYAAYLRGVISEQNGNAEDAYVAYLAAAGIGPSDPEPWTRLGALECGRDPARGREALDRALAIDATYAPAWVARARCATDPNERLRAAEKALASAPVSDDGLEPILAGREADADVTRRWAARLFAATLARPTDVDAWKALAFWAHDRGEARVEARALARWAQLEPRDRKAIAGSVERMAGEGALADARRAASAVALASPHEPSYSVTALAIDDALVAGDSDRAERVCLRAHVAVTVAAARALLLGRPALAASLSAPAAAADETNLEARVVHALAARARGDRAALASALAKGAASRAPLSIEAWVALARAAAIEVGPEAARVIVARVAHAEPVGARDGDALITPIAVSLAAASLVEPSELGPDGRVELAERTGDRSALPPVTSLDRRHALLALARSAPTSADTLVLARELAPSRGRDPLVAVAFARLAMAGAAGVAATPESLSAFDPADPLVATTALDLAIVEHDAGAIPIARRRLAAVARTPAERARLVE